MGQKRSLHIGLNFVDPDKYGGWDGELSGCINDANAMEQIAAGRGFATTKLIDGQATAEAVHQQLQAAAAELGDGDFFFITYSGHGGQVPDTDGTVDEIDGYDETWCLYDTQLLDDTLYGAFRTFKPGVRIFVMSDSCHSETVIRAPLMEHRQRRAFEDRHPGAQSKRAPLKATTDEYEAHVDDYKAQKAWWAGRGTPGTNADADVVLISGCQDLQTSMDGPGNGAFTFAFLQVWNRHGGSYPGSYLDLQRDVRNEVNNMDQLPCIFYYGKTVANMLLQMPLTDQKANVSGELAVGG